MTSPLPPRSFQDIVPHPESRKAFSAVERKKIDYLLGSSGPRTPVRRNLLRLAVGAALLALGMTFLPDRILGAIGRQAGWWLLALGVGPAVFFALLVPYLRRDYRSMRGYLQRTLAISESRELGEGLWVAKRSLWMIALFLPMTCVSMVALVHSLGLIAVPGVTDTRWVGKLFLVPWSAAVGLCLTSTSLLFESAVNAGILLKIHMLRTGEAAIRIPHGDTK
jgi:hypothetical protein